MYFRQTLVIDEPQIDAKGEVVLHAGIAQKIAVTLRPMDENDRGNFDRKSVWLAITCVERDPKDAIKSELTTCTERANRRNISEALTAYSSQISHDLNDAAVTAMRVLRWRLGLRGPHNPVRSSRGSQYSFDNAMWYPLPASYKVYCDSYTRPDITAARISQIDVLLQEGADEPIAHTLMREAYQQGHKNPRSALLMAFSAIEVGVKSCIVTLQPQTQWLLENMPSPPLEKLLRDYLPALPVTISGKPISIPSEVLEVIKKGVQIRNKLAHAGTPKIDLYFLDDLLKTGRDLIWLFDVMTGQRWAVAYIEGPLREVLAS